MEHFYLPRDGSLYVFDCVTGNRLLDVYKVHNTDAQTVDFHEDCIISGSRDRTIKVFCSIFLNFWDKLSEINDVISFVKVSNANITNTLLFFV